MKHKKIIIISSILLILIITALIVYYLYNYTTVFKSEEEVHEDLVILQNGISEQYDEENESLNDGIDAQVEDNVYSNYVGVSNGTLYIKENAGDKIKDAAKDTNIGYETSAKSNNGILIVEPYIGTNSVECKVISNTEDVVNLTAYNANNLYESFYILGSIKDKKIIEEGENSISYVKVAGNTTYTIRNQFRKGTNTVFFFDKDMKFIGSTTEKTFTTSSNTNYIKVMTDLEGLEELEGLEGLTMKYCLVLGTEEGNSFDTSKNDFGIDVLNQTKIDIPLDSEKMVIYVEGGEVELKYVSK